MFNSLPPLDILILAAIAAVVIYRLYNQFGKQPEGEEDEVITPSKPKTKEESAFKPLYSPDEPVEQTKAGKTKAWVKKFTALDPNFSEKSFLEGASIAFEMITNAAASGDTKTLKPLMSAELFNQVCEEIKQHQQQNQTLEVELVGVNDMSIKKASVKGAVATVQTIIDSEQYYCLYDSDRNLIAGDNEEVMVLRDIWHFQRDLSARDPNWKLIKMEELAEEEEDTDSQGSDDTADEPTT